MIYTQSVVRSPRFVPQSIFYTQSVVRTPKSEVRGPQSILYTRTAIYTVLMGIRDDLLRAMKKGEVTLMVLADLSKAFDTVRYKTLTIKLFSFGFSKNFLRWLTRCQIKLAYILVFLRGQFLGQRFLTCTSLISKIAFQIQLPLFSMQMTPPSVKAVALLILLNLQ